MKIYHLIYIAMAMLFAPPVLAQSPNNAVWGVNDQNEVFRWNQASKQFEQMPGSLNSRVFARAFNLISVPSIHVFLASASSFAILGIFRTTTRAAARSLFQEARQLSLLR